MRHPSMTTRGTRISFAFAVLIVFFLPKRVECGYPGVTRGHAGKWRTTCTDFEIEPLAFYMIEVIAGRDIGFAYSAGEDCR